MQKEVKKMFEVKPERLYPRFTGDISSLSIGEQLLVKITGYETTQKRVCCQIVDGGPKCYIPEENFIFPSYFLNKKYYDGIPVEIMDTIGRYVITEIENINSDGTIELNRSRIMERTVNYLSENIGATVEAIVKEVVPYGAFIDIGNGVVTLLHVRNISISRMRNVCTYLKRGNKIKVVIESFDSKKCRFKTSRKAAYKKEQLLVGSVVLVSTKEPVGYDGIFVEYNPATRGIMDIPPNVKFKEHQKVFCYIKGVKEVGFKAKFLYFC